MKKIILTLLTVGLLLAMTACGNSQTQNTPPVQKSENTPAVQPAQIPEETESVSDSEPEQEPETGGVLVVYYSATGSTETVAGYIANALNADTFSITPTEPYTSDDLNWRDTDSRVSREHDDPALRTVELTSATVENWDSYDTVFVGYPIWWGIAAWPLDSFVSANDFTGKTVIPFCTSSSSGMGESGQLLADLAGTGDWLEGQRFRSSVNETAVVDWVNSLNVSE